VQHDKLNVANTPSDLKYHDDNRYKTAVVSRISLCGSIEDNRI